MTSTGGLYICIKQFNARLGDELSLKVGDKLEVLADDSEYNDGWYMGKNVVSNEVGLYPKSFTQVLQEQAPGSLLRSRSRKVVSGVKTKTLPQTPKSDSSTLSHSAEKASSYYEKHSQSRKHSESSAPSAPAPSFDYPEKVNSTMSEIDKALHELQISSFNDDTSHHDSSSRRDASRASSHYDTTTLDDEGPLNMSKKISNFSNGSTSTFGNNSVLGSLGTSSRNVSASNGSSTPATGSAPPITSHSTGTARHSRNPSTQSLTEDLNPLKAAEWTPQQVSSYFAIVLGFDLDIAGKFARHKITGAILFQLDLAHLKELEIDSFGTRFEIHKEIEKLRQISSRNAKHKSMSRSNSTKNINSAKHSPDFSKIPENSSSVHKESNLRESSSRDSYHPGSVVSPERTGRSASQLMPSASLNKTHQRRRSHSLDEKRASVFFSPSENSFASPRKAPEPPAHPSPINRGYKFGGSLSPDPNMYMTRTNASVNGLGLAGMSRPASSVYESSMISHNRNVSNSSGQMANGIPSAGGPGHHRRNSSAVSGGQNNRHSGFFSFLSGGATDDKKKLQSNNLFRDNLDLDNALDNDSDSDNDIALESPQTNAGFGKLISPAKLKRENSLFSPKQRQSMLPDADDSLDDSNVIGAGSYAASPKKSKSVSYRDKKEDRKSDLKEEKRSASDNVTTSPAVQISRLKTLRTTSTQNFRNLTQSKKSKTSAFQEGIRDCSAEDATKDANYSGWISKRSGNSLSWRSRYFVLHGTRLSYFTSFKDKKEKGLIDITAHKVIAINPDHETGNDKYVAMYASSTGYGRFCFKVVPPAPGFKKGLTFTQPKTHYFAVDTLEDMRGWLKALMVATIDIDESVPVVSSCSTPTVSLAKAQELLAKAREETRLKDEELRARGYLRDGVAGANGSSGSVVQNGTSNGTSNTNGNAGTTNGSAENTTTATTTSSSTTAANTTATSTTNTNITGFGLDSDYGQYLQELNSDIQTSLDSNNSPNIDSVDETTVSSIPLKPSQPKLTVDTNGTAGTNTAKPLGKTPSTPQLSSPSNGFASPYLLASGLLSPKSGNSSPARTPGSASTPDYFQESHGSTPNLDATPKSGFSARRKKNNSEKMLAYTSDGSGNHTFVIKSKK